MNQEHTTSRTTRLTGTAVAAWALLVTGVGHTVLVVVSAVSETPRDQLDVRQAMVETTTRVAGLDRSLWQLFSGFSLVMALLLVGFGALNLLLVRRHPGVLLESRAVLWLDLAVVLTALGIAVRLLPAPPIVLLGLAVVAVVVALSRPDASFDGAPAAVRD